MELILSRPSVMRTFTAEWKMKWVPAIVEYSRGLKKKDVVAVLSGFDGDPSGE